MTGSLFIVASPSGGGKTTLVDRLIQELPDLKLSISFTTRPPRPSEENGKNYYFINQKEFNDLIHKNAFLEYAEVFGHFYGTPKKWIEEQTASGTDVILEIDWQGARAIKHLYPQTSVGIFVLPPSRHVVLERLKFRDQDSKEVIQHRMSQFSVQVSHYVDFDYIIINDKFEQAYQELQSIVIAHRLTRIRQLDKFKHLIHDLLENKLT